MIQITPQMRILVAVEPVDFRNGIDGLSGICRRVLEEEPFSGTLFVFCNRRRTALKILSYDGQGLPEDKGSAHAVELVRQADRDMPAWARTGWRWRILFLRALIDRDMFVNQGIPSAACEPYFEELIGIYHARHALPLVYPPTKANRDRTDHPA